MKIKVHGKDYTLNPMTPAEFLKELNACTDPQFGFDEEKLFDFALEKLIKSPKTTLDDFEDYTVVDALAKEVLSTVKGERTIDLKTIKMQKPLPRDWMRIKKRIFKFDGSRDIEALTREMLEHVVIEPRMAVEDFKTYSDLEAVVQEAHRFCTT